MPDPPPLAPGHNPVVGHTLTFLRDPLGSLERWGASDSPVVRIGVAGKRACLVADPAIAREVLGGERYTKADIVRERLGTLQGGSLVLLEGEQWRERRGLLQSGFTRERVAGAAERTSRYATEAVESWPADHPVRVDREMRDLSLSVLAAALFGLDIRGEHTPIHDAADDILGRMDMGSVSTYLPEWVPTPTNRRFRRAVDTLHDRLDETVTRRAGSDGTAGNPDLLSTMLSAGLPPETVRDELVAFLFAGFDSMATALSCTLGLLAGHPDVQADVRDELDAAAGGDASDPETLADLPLLTAVVRESLRLYPPQYVLFREPTEPVTLGGCRVDPGTIVLVAPWVFHRDPNVWSAPERFRPGRWLDDEGAVVDRGHSDAYIPYGGGPRYCLGARLADQTLRLVVADVCQRRRLARVGALSVSAGPTLSLDGGVSVRARPLRS